ncbi:response regulator, partial [Hydrogenivirga sp. 128-5-R1-1]|uniref:response regulator transcription factor n=1 Tax=Hydrogenivirga sp. 128-5-R1-1 TaxID=392423 RepID=UPI00015F2B13
MPFIYVVEDDEDINELLVYNLQKEGNKVKSFYSGKDALSSLENEKPDLILLDIMLPDIDGLEVCKTVKSDPVKREIPIIMLTAKSTEIDKIVGLELGADDYITKPFSFRELLARIKAVLRRCQNKSSKNVDVIKIGELEINLAKFEVKIHGKPLNLTTKEFKLLMNLINSKGRVLSRDYLLDTVWQNEPDVFDRTVDVHIKNL